MTPARIIPAVVVLAGSALIVWFFWFFWPASAPPPPPPGPAKTEAPAPTGPRFPVASKPSEPLPTLKESDVTVVESLKGLVGADRVAKLFVPENLIGNIVATMDNLPREHVSRRLWPVTSPGGTMKTSGRDDKLAISADNGVRYKLYVEAFDKADPAAVVGAYVHFYPLFQQAYVELGYPNGYFKYADPDLESRSSGQKLLVRLGPDNEARVKAKLREYRKEVVAQTSAAPR